MNSFLVTSRTVDPISLKTELEQIFSPAEVRYSVMTDSFQIRDRHYRHRLQYNTHKPSRLDSQSAAIRRFTFFFNLGLVVFVVLLLIMDRRWSWGFLENEKWEDLYFFGLIMLIGLMQYLIPVLRPELKRGLEAEHVRVRQALERLLM